MPDISKCSNTKCPSREKCYRYRVKPSEMQSYADFKPDGEKCSRFISIDGWPQKDLIPEQDLVKNRFER